MLCNHAIIGGVVSDSLLLSAPAEAVEAICGVMPPVLFQGSIDHIASRALRYTRFILHTMMMPTANLGEILCYFFCTPQKSAKRL